MDERGRTGVQPAGRPRLTLRGWGISVAAAVVFIVASVLSNRDLLTLACLLAAMPVTGLVYVRRRRVRLDVFRSFSPDVVSVNSVCVVTLEVRNRADRPMASTLCRDENAMLDDSPVLDLHGLGAVGGGPRQQHSQTTLRYSLTPTERGIHAIGPLVVRKSDLFGLVYWDSAFGGTQPLAVVPPITELDAEQFSIGGADGAVDATRLASTGGSDDTLPREYRPGDAMRRVHWRATARHGDLMVRQDEQQNDPECWIILDNRLVGHGGQVRRLGIAQRGITTPSFEWAVAMAASIAVHARQEGYLARIVHTAHSDVDATTHDSSQEPESEHDLLLSMASVQLIGGRVRDDYIFEVSDSMRSAGGRKPLFAVIGDVGDEEATHLARLAQLSRPAIAFVVDGTPAVQRVLEDSGWLCVVVAEDEDPQAAWLQAASLRRSAHVGR